MCSQIFSSITGFDFLIIDLKMSLFFNFFYRTSFSYLSVGIPRGHPLDVHQRPHHVRGPRLGRNQEITFLRFCEEGYLEACAHSEGLLLASAVGFGHISRRQPKNHPPPPPWFARKSLETMLVYGGFD